VSGDGGRGRPAARASRATVTVLLGRFLPAEVAPVEVVAEVDGRAVGRATVDAARSRLDRRRVVPLTFEVEVPPGETVAVTLRSPGWVPRDEGVGTDGRVLGVPVAGWSAGAGWSRGLVRAVPLLATEQDARFGALDSYDQVLANSRYTQGWIERMWGRPSQVLYPPVTLVPRLPKRPLILSVGRFFVPGTGHNKKQLELVRAFRALVASGRAADYELHLVGGCAPEHQSYLDQVAAEGEGLAVVLHPDASGAELRQLYGEASIYWHAAGLDEDPDRHPERLEHFGITTVEAMSAGAVPVVIDAAGQTEIVEHGVSGYRFRDLDDLVAHTLRLVDDGEQRNKMSLAAEERAQLFGWDAFVGNVRAALDL
jgi:glycosyltransferase involved in cell wall biosynthesis